MWKHDQENILVRFINCLWFSKQCCCFFCFFLQKGLITATFKHYGLQALLVLLRFQLQFHPLEEAACFSGMDRNSLDGQDSAFFLSPFILKVSEPSQWLKNIIIQDFSTAQRYKLTGSFFSSVLELSFSPAVFFSQSRFSNPFSHTLRSSPWVKTTHPGYLTASTWCNQPATCWLGATWAQQW